MIISEKWLIYVLTFLTYAAIHSIRTSWSSLKPILNKQPYLFSSIVMGQLDMTVLLCYALGLHMFGWMASKWNVKIFLQVGILGLVIVQFVLAIVLFKGQSEYRPYFVIYGIIGFLSCTGWPACFQIMSKYFSKKDGIVLCLWNGSSQAGDFMALFISYLVVKDEDLTKQEMTGRIIVGTACVLLGIMIINQLFLNPKNLKKSIIEQKVQSNKSEGDPPKEQSQKQNQLVEEQLQKQYEKSMSSQIKIKIDFQKKVSQIVPPKQPSVNFLNVWCLPSVIPLVFTFSMVKAVNSIIVNWLVFYLALVQLKRESRVITIAWSVSIVIGGIISAKFNRNLDKKYFIAALLICSCLFLGLQQMHVSPHSFEVLLLIVLCGLLFGGPYNLMGTAVPLMLGQKEQIKSRKGAMAAIVSAMQGGAQLIGAFFMVVIPSIGVVKMHWVPAFLCLFSAFILIAEQLKQQKKQQKVQQQRQNGINDIKDIKGINESIQINVCEKKVKQSQ